MKKVIKNMWAKVNNNSGAIGIKEIAATVALIVVIGLILGVVNTNIGSWVAEIWTLFIDQIKGLMS